MTYSEVPLQRSLWHLDQFIQVLEKPIREHAIVNPGERAKAAGGGFYNTAWWPNKANHGGIDETTLHREWKHSSLLAQWYDDTSETHNEAGGIGTGLLF